MPNPFDRFDAPASANPFDSFDNADAASSWSDLPGNILPSAGRFVGDISHAVMHPINTAQSLGRTAIGAAQKTGLVASDEQDFRPYADAVGRMLKDRYGSAENIRRTIIDDPVGAAADLSMLLSGGGSAAARLPGTAGKIGDITAATGRTINPLTAPVGLAKGATAAAPHIIGSIGTHTGPVSLETAAKAGFEGGESARILRENMRGQAPMDETVAEARRAVGDLRQNRGAAYRSGMAGVRADKTILPFDKIDDALIRATNIKTFKSQSLSPSTQKIRADMTEAIQQWRALPPAQYHTAEGLDALKQKLGDLRDATERGTPSRLVADDIYHAARQTIVDQAPEYARVMRAYEEATSQVREIEKTLSLDPNATIDTALRKLQSVLRDNVNTNYGQRRVLVEMLNAPHLMERLAGQSLSAWFPRGLGRMVASHIGAGALGALGAGAPGAAVGAAAAMPFMSPRLMGETAYYGGRAAKPLSKVPLRAGGQAAFQAGRLSDDGLEEPADVLKGQ